MRILSQDGMIDVPYEQCGFIVFFNELFSGNWDINANIGGNKAYKMAEYSTEAKGRKAMEMLHDVYVAHENYKKLDGYIQIEVSKREGIEKAIMYGGIFQFPSDDEVEV